MVDSRDKGTRAEYAVRDLLRASTGLQWERVPGSGGLNAAHGMKGDIYLSPSSGHLSKFCIEVKHYKDEQFNSNMLKPTKSQSQMEKWLLQTEREAIQINSKPMLVFKKDRGEWFAAVPIDDEIMPKLDNIVPFSTIMLSVAVKTYKVVPFKLLLEALDNEDLAR